MHDRVKCNHCAGTGAAKLRKPLQQTLDACRYLGAREQPITSVTVERALPEPAELPAVYQRLLSLKAKGFLRRVPCTHPIQFRLVARRGRQVTRAEVA
jgi:hypothetical protein